MKKSVEIETYLHRKETLSVMLRLVFIQVTNGGPLNRMPREPRNRYECHAEDTNPRPCRELNPLTELPCFVNYVIN